MVSTTNKFAPYLDVFHTVRAELQAKDWFTPAWEIVVAYYGEGDQPNPGFTLQKTNWFNDQGAGIHFESWLRNADLKRSAIPIAMHFETSYDRSGIRRGAFHDYVLTQGKAIIDQLGDYKLSPKSMQLLINRVPFTDATLVDVMAREYCRLQPLAAVIDDAIEAVKEK